MDFSFLPKNIMSALSKIDVDKLCEIRLRKGFNIRLKMTDDKNYPRYLFDAENKKIKCEEDDIKCILKHITEGSMYAFNDRIKQGFITIQDGIRVGVVGECVYDEEKLLSIKNISSLNVRIPHEIFGCADNIFEKICFNDTVLNTLIISPAGYGKTTILKDIARKLNEIGLYNIVLIDERGEFLTVKGENIDSIMYSNKYYAFNVILRTMTPQVVITDELIDKSDWECVNNAVNSGVKVLASCHASEISGILNNENFISKLFDRYVLLNSEGQAGVVKAIYDKEFVCV